MIARETSHKLFEQRDRFPGLAFAAIKSAEQYLGVHLVDVAFAADLFESLHAVLLIAMEAGQKTQQPPGPRQATNNIIMHALNQPCIIVGGIELRDSIAVLASGGGIAQRIAPCSPHQKRVVRAQT